MIYVTTRLSPAVHQMTLDELLSGKTFRSWPPAGGGSSTRTFEMDAPSYRMLKDLPLMRLIVRLEQFNESARPMLEAERASLYHTFRIPKKSGGLRRIDAPNEELKTKLRELKTIFEKDFGILYHTSAFAYVKGRSTVDAVKKHQQNGSRWFAKLDLHDFFGSTTKEFVMRQFAMIFPFSEIMRSDRGRAAMSAALSLAFLNDGLPQGTPISPLITNVMMIPIDYKLAQAFRKMDARDEEHRHEQSGVYTRYADDFIISGRYDFDIRQIEKTIIDVLAGFSAPFTLNREKTRYGSSAGQNWNLGVMLNKNNEITVGYKNKNRFQSMLYNFVRDSRRGISWETGDIQHLLGLYSYYRMVEKKNIDALVSHFNEKEKTDVIRQLRQAVSGAA